MVQKRNPLINSTKSLWHQHAGFVFKKKNASEIRATNVMYLCIFAIFE